MRAENRCTVGVESFTPLVDPTDHRIDGKDASRTLSLSPPHRSHRPSPGPATPFSTKHQVSYASSEILAKPSLSIEMAPSVVKYVLTASPLGRGVESDSPPPEGRSVERLEYGEEIRVSPFFRDVSQLWLQLQTLLHFLPRQLFYSPSNPFPLLSF